MKLLRFVSKSKQNLERRKETEKGEKKEKRKKKEKKPKNEEKHKKNSNKEKNGGKNQMKRNVFDLLEIVHLLFMFSKICLFVSTLK